MRQRWFLGLQLIAVASLLGACSGGTEEAKQGVSGFRTRVANGAVAEIYRTASPEFRHAITEEQFQRFMAGLDRKLGSWQSAEAPAWNIRRGTGGHFVALTYQSKFSRGGATEQFTWRIDHGTAVLVGYNINSVLLVSD
jgi:hypothetical protein